jgi:hypothetical protein
MSKVFSISQYDGNSGAGNAVFSKTGKLTNTQHMSFQKKAVLTPNNASPGKKQAVARQDKEKIDKIFETIKKKTEYQVPLLV